MKLKTERQILGGLCRVSPNLPMQIQVLAEERNMDVDSLTNYQMYLLIKLEADMSDNPEYTQKLLDLAEQIDTE